MTAQFKICFVYISMQQFIEQCKDSARQLLAVPLLLLPQKVLITTSPQNFWGSQSERLCFGGVSLPGVQLSGSHAFFSNLLNFSLYVFHLHLMQLLWHPDLLANLCGSTVLSGMREEIFCAVTNSYILQLHKRPCYFVCVCVLKCTWIDEREGKHSS